MKDFLGIISFNQAISTEAEGRVAHIASTQGLISLKEEFADYEIIWGSSRCNEASKPALDKFYGYSVLFDGMIYNYNELACTFHENNTEARSISELIALLFRQHGPECFLLLNGDFSCALFDIKNRCLFIASDKIGPRKIYYTYNNGLLLFATRMKMIIQMLGAAPEIDNTFLSKYFAYGFVPSPNTPLKGIKKIPSGNYLVCKNDGIRLHQYWNLKFRNKEEIDEKETNYSNGIYDLLIESTKRRLNTNCRNGVFLSGGLDSSSLVAAMSELMPSHSIKSFTAIFNERSFDESTNARIIASHFDTDHKEILFTPQKALHFIEQLLDRIDEPFSDDDVICGGLLSPIASDTVDEIFTGDGPDEIFMGYPSFLAHRVTNLYERIPKSVRKHIEQFAEKLPVSYRYRSFDSQFKQFVGGLDYPAEIRDAAWWGPFPPKYQNCLFRDDIQKEMDFHHTHVYSEVEETLLTVNTNDITEEILSIYIKLLGERWLMKLNAVSQGTSLRFKFPYLDSRLIEYVNLIPSRFKLKSKYILRKGLQTHLPKQIVNGTKRPFFVPLAKWIKNDFKSLILDSISEKNTAAIGSLNYSYVSKLLEQHYAGKANNTKQIWNILILVSWYKRMMA